MRTILSLTQEIIEIPRCYQLPQNGGASLSVFASNVASIYPVPAFSFRTRRLAR